MVYLVHSATRFWRCENNNTTTVTTTFGVVGSNGRTVTKQFNTKKEANKYVKDQADIKRQGGYKDTNNYNNNSNNNNNKTSSGNNKRSNSNGTNNEVDFGLAKIDATLASRVEIHDGSYHASLAFINPRVNQDKYFIMQLLVDSHSNNNSKKKQRTTRSSSPNKKPLYYLYTRWGDTGTTGQTRLEDYNDETSAKNAFHNLFKHKVGVDWSVAMASHAPKTGHYEYLALPDNNNNDNDDVEWHYYLQNDPLGKADGWYPYEDNNKKEMELLHGQFIASKKSSRLSKRYVKNPANNFTYQVDFAAMTQTNTHSGTKRPIRRT